MMNPTFRTAVIACTLALGLAGCDLFGPDIGPPAQLDARIVSGDLVVGNTVEAELTVLDSQDREVEGHTVRWTASGGGTASPSSSETDGQGRATTSWTLHTVAGTQTLTARAGDVHIELSVEVEPGALTEVVVTPPATTLESLGDTLQLEAVGLDEYGNEVATPALSWSSSDPIVASVAGGVVVSHAEGTVEVTATTGGFGGTATVTVDQVVAGIGMDPTAPVMVVDETITVDARMVDARGFAVDTTLPLSWASSNTAVATVTDAGVVSAVAAGTATVTASYDTWVGEAEVAVKTGPRPTITDIAPAVLGAGDTATITGTAFGTDPGLVEVTVAGVAGTLITLTDTLLTAQLPPPGTFPCAPAGDEEVAVIVDELDATTTHPVAGAARHTLAAGESVALLGDDVACNELANPGTYALSVFNASTSASLTTAFRLQGTASGTAAQTALPRIEESATRPEPRVDPELEGHLRMLERNRRLVEELGAPEPEVRSTLPTAAQEVGDVRAFRIQDLDGQLCTDYIEVGARAVYSGTYGVIWEDTLAPLAGTMDTTWDDMGAEYDNVMHQILLDYFGDPLAYDDQLDDNGLFFMLFSETVNNYDSVAVNGFVFSGDFFPRTGTGQTCPASNEGEIFYGRVPTQSGDDFSAGTVADWRWRMRSTVIHEVKHLTAYANKFDVNASVLEETGLEEATARLAEEFFGRALQGYGQGDNVTYQESIYCERRPTWPECNDVPLIMAKHYSGVNEYLKTPALLSPFGRANPDDNSFYGSGWQWVRWAIDQSALGEADIIKPLIREPSLTGPDNLADKVGDRTVAELLADYTLAFAIDDHPSGVIPARAALAIPSWDTRDIFQGLHDDYAGTSIGDTYYPTAWPLDPVSVSGGSFQVDVAEIHGGGAVIFDLSGMSSAQLLELLSASGGTAPSSLGLSIVRIQ